MRKNIYKVLLVSSLVFLLAFIIAYFIGYGQLTGPFLILFFVLLAFGVRGYPATRGFSYTLGIFTAVTASMFYPEWFLSIGDFQLKLLIVPLLQIIMFGMGSQMNISDFAGVIKMPKGVIAGLICQFTIMPILGFTIANSFNFPPEIAAGVILIGVSPSGLASNVMAFIAKANLALSITITAFATLLSPLVTPLLMKLLGGQFIQLDFWKMMLDIFDLVILPIIAGLIFNIFAFGFKSSKKVGVQILAYLFILLMKNFIFWQTSTASLGDAFENTLWNLLLFFVLPVVLAFIFKFLAKGNKSVLENILSFLSMAGIALIITIITATGRDSLLQVGGLLILAMMIHNLFGYILGYSAAKVIGMNEQDCRSISLEVGMQNGGLASGLALQMGKVATVGLAAAVFGPLMNITASVLANYWRGKKDKQTPEEKKKTEKIKYQVKKTT